MKHTSGILILILLALNLQAQTAASASQTSGGQTIVSGILTYSAVYGLGSGGYIAPVTGNIEIPAPQLQTGNSNIDLTVYPNPASSVVTVRLSYNGQIRKFQTEIFDQTGKKLQIQNSRQYSANTAIARINLETLPAGNYFLHIIVNNDETSFKIIKK